MLALPNTRNSRTLSLHQSRHLRRLSPVDRIDQLAITAKGVPVRSENQSREMRDLRLILFLRQRTALHDFTFPKQIGELLIQLIQRFVSQRLAHAKDQLRPNPA